MPNDTKPPAEKTTAQYLLDSLYARGRRIIAGHDRLADARRAIVQLASRAKNRSHSWRDPEPKFAEHERKIDEAFVSLEKKILAYLDDVRLKQEATGQKVEEENNGKN